MLECFCCVDWCCVGSVGCGVLYVLCVYCFVGDFGVGDWFVVGCGVYVVVVGSVVCQCVGVGGDYFLGDVWYVDGDFVV